jgi:hypothetical protein
MYNWRHAVRLRLAGWFRVASGSTLSSPKIHIKASTLRTKQKANLVGEKTLRKMFTQIFCKFLTADDIK